MMHFIHWSRNVLYIYMLIYIWERVVLCLSIDGSGKIMFMKINIFRFGIAIATKKRPHVFVARHFSIWHCNHHKEWTTSVCDLCCISPSSSWECYDMSGHSVDVICGKDMHNYISQKTWIKKCLLASGNWQVFKSQTDHMHPTLVPHLNSLSNLFMWAYTTHDLWGYGTENLNWQAAYLYYLSMITEKSGPDMSYDHQEDRKKNAVQITTSGTHFMCPWCYH